MVRLAAGILILLSGASSVLAQSSGPNTRVYNDNDFKPRARFVCVIDPPKSADRTRPYTCRAPEGRAGGRCRCDGVTGNGTLRPAG
jgi:hypothetical protein